MGSAAEGVDPIQAGSRDFGDGRAFFGIHDSGDVVWNLFRVPPGERQLLGRIRFLVRGDAPVGTAKVEPVTTFPGIGGNTDLSLAVGDDGSLTGFDPEPLLPGAVEVEPPWGCAPSAI